MKKKKRSEFSLLHTRKLPLLDLRFSCSFFCLDAKERTKEKIKATQSKLKNWNF
jgi:hypothetical protein